MRLQDPLPQTEPRPIEQLHHALRAQDHDFTVSLEDFEADMQDDAARQELYGNLKALDETFTASFEEFSQDMGVKKKAQSAGPAGASPSGAGAAPVYSPEPFPGLLEQTTEPEPASRPAELTPGRAELDYMGTRTPQLTDQSAAALAQAGQEEGFWSAFGKTLRNTLDPRQVGGNLLDYAGDAYEMLGNSLGLTNGGAGAIPGVSLPIREDKITDRRAQRLRDEAKADALPLADNAKKSVFEGSFWENLLGAPGGALLGQGTGSIVQVGVASALGGPGAGIAAGAGLSVSATKDAAREAGISDKEATVTATVLAPVVGVLEELGLGFITKNKAATKLLQGEIIKRALAYGEGKILKANVVRAASELLPDVVKRAASGALGEAGTEFAQGVAEGEAQVLADELRGNEGAAPGNGRYGTTQGQVLAQATEGALAGGILGGAAGGLAGAVQGQPTDMSMEAQNIDTSEAPVQPIDTLPAAPAYAVPADVTPQEQARAQQAYPQPVAVVRPTGQPMFSSVQVVGVSEDGTMARVVGEDATGQPLDTTVPTEYIQAPQAEAAPLESLPVQQPNAEEQAPADPVEELVPEVMPEDQAVTAVAKLPTDTASEAEPVSDASAPDSPTAAPTKPAKAERLAAIQAERTQAIADLKNTLRGKRRSNTAYGTFLPIDPELAQAVATILKTYAQEGLVHAQDFLTRFRQEVGTAEETGLSDEQLRTLVPAPNPSPAGQPPTAGGTPEPAGSAADLAMAMWYSNTLSSPITHVVNSVANTYQTMMEALVATGNVAAQGGKAAAPVRGLANGLRVGAKQATEVLRTGEAVSAEDSKFEIPTALETRDKAFGGMRGALADAGKVPVGQTALNLTIAAQKYVPRLLKAADIFYQTGLREMRAWELAAVEAAKEGRTEPTRNTWEAIYEKLANTTERQAAARTQATSEGHSGRAHTLRMWELMEQSRRETLGAEATEQTRLYAARAVFNGEMEGTLGVIFTAVNSAVERIGPVARFVVPFAKVITNVANGYSDYTLLGAVRWAKGSIGFERYGEQYRRYTAEERAKVLAKSMLGAVVMAALYAASHRKDERDSLQLSGPGPQDKKLKEQLQQNGWLPYSVKVGEKWVSYKESPLFFVLGALGALNDYERYEGSQPDTDPTYVDKASVLLLQTMQAVVETTPTKGLSDLLAALTSPGGKELWPYLSRLGSSAATGYVPGSALLRQFSRELQAFSGADKKEAASAWQRVQQDLPVFRDKLRPALDALGEPVKVRTDRLISDKPTHRDPQIQQLWDFLLEKEITLPVPNQRTLVVPAWQEQQGGSAGKGKSWQEAPPSDVLYYRLLQVRGKLLKSALLAELPQLQQASATEARKRVKQLAQEATREAKREVARSALYSN